MGRGRQSSSDSQRAYHCDPPKHEAQLDGTSPEVFSGLSADSEIPFPLSHQWRLTSTRKATLVRGRRWGKALLWVVMVDNGAVCKPSPARRLCRQEKAGWHTARLLVWVPSAAALCCNSGGERVRQRPCGWRGRKGSLSGLRGTRFLSPGRGSGVLLETWLCWALCWLLTTRAFWKLLEGQPAHTHKG